jgi:hydantoinase/carbamoylase family amidase
VTPAGATPGGVTGGRARIEIDGVRLLGRLTRLAAAGSSADGGVTRLAWSAEMVEAAGLVTSWAEQAGASVHLDGALNLIAEVPGTQAGLPPIVTGSHLDTVIAAGPLDGAYGVVAGIEVLASLKDTGLRLRHPVRVVAYANEEGVVAPPFTGSRAIAGTLDPTELHVLGADGLTLADRLARAGAHEGGPIGARWPGPVAATIELHIEQGPVLDRTGLTIGVVTAIAAQQRGTIVITGSANHAGTTPMDMRSDALVAAAQAVLAVRDLAIDGIADVATAGRIQVSPNVANVVPGDARLSFDIRSGDGGGIRAAVDALTLALEEIEVDTRTTIAVALQALTPAVPTDLRLRGLIGRAAAKRGLRAVEIVSGAGHDCANLSELGPIAMIFVPSVGGVSHHPSESTEAADLIAGASVLLDTLVAADRYPEKPRRHDGD